MTKIIKIISNNLITGVEYGLVEINDEPSLLTPQTPRRTNTNAHKNKHPKTHSAKQIKQPGRRWEQKMTGAKKRIMDEIRTKQK